MGVTDDTDVVTEVVAIDRAIDVDVELAEHDVSVVVVVMVDDVFVGGGVTAHSSEAPKHYAGFFFLCFLTRLLSCSMFCTLKGTVGGILQM
jgi:hypothetical protein